MPSIYNPLQHQTRNTACNMNSKNHFSSLILFIVHILLLSKCQCQQSQCSLTRKEIESQDPALVKMRYNIGDGKKTFWAYVTPPVSSFYQSDPPASRKVTPMHSGQAAKFINLSNNSISVYWEPQPGAFDEGKAVEIRRVPPFSAKGTSTFPTHSFVYATTDDGVAVKRFVVQDVDNAADDVGENLYPYDPYDDPSNQKKTQEIVKQQLSKQDQEMYWTWRKTLSFDKEYRKVTGRTYLASYRRPPPIHFMWPANYFNQVHWVTTRETHFISSPGDIARTTVNLRRIEGDEPIALEQYRDQAAYLNMSLKVLSCAPRVFEIENFLSPIEVDHIIELGTAATLGESTLGDEGGDPRKRNVRTSKNTWVSRHQSAIIDSIYRRAADLMRIDEALLRSRTKEEEQSINKISNNLKTANKSIAEDLQLVHYSVSQEYQVGKDYDRVTIDFPLSVVNTNETILYLFIFVTYFRRITISFMLP